jgi:AcrR family transcriptional regulator
MNSAQQALPSDQKEVVIRRRIVATAMQLIREMGCHKTTVADIARELSMSAGNVYRYFNSKSQINEAVCRKILDEVEEVASGVSEEPEPASERLRRMIKAIERMNTQRYVSDVKLHEMIVVASNECWVVTQEHELRIKGFLAKIISDGIIACEFHDQDPLAAAALVHTAMIRFWYPHFIVGRCKMTEPRLDQMTDFCLRALSAARV